MNSKIIGMAFLGGAAALAGSTQAGTCRDPWVTQAITEVTGRPPVGNYESGDCSISNYGGGHWSGYADLVSKVRARAGGASPAVAGSAYPGQVAGASLAARSASSGSIVGQGGGNLVNTNGSNIVGQGGLNRR